MYSSKELADIHRSFYVLCLSADFFKSCFGYWELNKWKETVAYSKSDASVLFFLISQYWLNGGSIFGAIR